MKVPWTYINRPPRPHPLVPATAFDYTWFRKRFAGLAKMYCLTIVHGLTPAELLRRFEVRAETRVTGVGQLLESAFDTWERHIGGRCVLGVTATQDWALAIEPNGVLGVTETTATALSRGTTLVSHYRNVNAPDSFYWIEDGDIRLHFEPSFPARRDGSDPDGLLRVMRKVGFDPRGSDERRHEQRTEAVFALAEYITGLRLTAELLDSATYVCGTAPAPQMTSP